MKLQEAYEKLKGYVGIPFKDLFSFEDLNTIVRNKGKTGQLLEMLLKKKLDNANIDFEDGELKSNKCDKNGKPLETVFVTQICGIIDDLLCEKPFEETHLYEKVNNILYVQVCKEGKPEDWKLIQMIHIDLTKPEFSTFLETWRQDYYSICRQLNQHIETSADGFIHTSNGTHLQIRSKDSKPYHSIYSKTYGRYVSNKNHAFYFQKAFVFDVLEAFGRISNGN
jgi:DNA mismatch repair protein MutH